MGARQQGAEFTQDRWLTLPRTLSFVTNGDDVLLIKRAAHKRVFPNQYNGLGGHIERHEDPFSSALREIHEESGLQTRSLMLRSIHNIDAGAETGIILFVFTAISDSRAIREDCSEGKLEWIARDRIPDLDLVEDLPTLLPKILDMGAHDPPIYAHVSYDSSDSIVLRFRAGVHDFNMRLGSA
ncbi:MAG: NUDIX domain-containing protein [Chloroflexi bacterium]|nr:NUDIX domain-containing protein [Chloroflexota bacterium]